jgi:hypothetical protein
MREIDSGFSYFYEEFEDVKERAEKLGLNRVEKLVCNKLYHMIYYEACYEVIKQAPDQIEADVYIKPETFHIIFSNRDTSKKIMFALYRESEVGRSVIKTFTVDFSDFVQEYKNAYNEALKSVFVEVLQLLEIKIQEMQKKQEIVEMMKKEQEEIIKYLDILEKETEMMEKIIEVKTEKIKIQELEQEIKEIEKEIIEKKQELETIERKREETKEKISIIEKTKNYVKEMMENVIETVKDVVSDVVDNVKSFFRRFRR